jgi:hypothetical protein
MTPQGVLGLALLLGACAGGAQAPRGTDPARPGNTDPRANNDSVAANLIPVGYGTLRQDDVALRVQMTNLVVKAIPLDEAVIRTLSPDSYRALRGILTSRQTDVERVAQRYNLRERRVWLVSFFGVQAEARFSPREVRVTSVGREFQPLEVIPLTAGFGEQRLQPRETQSALYVFEDGLDVEQALTLAVESERTDAWQATLRLIERERALIRSRASRAPGSAPGSGVRGPRSGGIIRFHSGF